MAKRQFLPVREVLRGRRLSWVDLVVAAGIIATLYGVVKLGRGMTVNLTAGLLACVIGLVIFGFKKIELADFLPSLVVAPLLTWWW